MAGRILTLGTGRIGSGVDFSSFADAAAKAVAGDVIKVLPGTHLFDTVTLAAGVKVVGVGRGACILQTTLDVLNNIAISCGHMTSFQNVWIRGNPTGTVDLNIKLIDFNGATLTQYILLDNVKVDNGGGSQRYIIYAPCIAADCWVNVRSNIFGGCIGIRNRINRWNSTFFTSSVSSSYDLIYSNNSSEVITLVNCLLTSTVSNMWTGSSYGNVRVIGCTFTDSSKASNLSTGSVCVICGSILSGGTYNLGGVGGSIRCIGNTKYLLTPSFFSDSQAYEFDSFGTYTNGISSNNLSGWMCFYESSYAGAVTLNLAQRSYTGVPSIAFKDISGGAMRYPITIQRNTMLGTDTFDLPTLTATPSYVIRENFGNALLSKGSTAGVWRVYGSSRPTKANIQGDIQTLGLMQRGSATPDGTTGMRGEGLLGTITSSPAGTWGVQDKGGRLGQSTANIGDRAYSCTSSNTGPISASSNFDLTFAFWPSDINTNLRFVFGIWDKTGRLTTDALDNNDPDGPHVLVMKPDGVNNSFRLQARNDTVLNGGTMNSTAITNLASGQKYYISLKKRGDVFTAIISQDITGGLNSIPAILTKTILATSDLCVVCGFKDVSSGVATTFYQYGWYAHQFPSTLVSL